MYLQCYKQPYFHFHFQIIERKTAVLFCAYQYMDGNLHKYLQIDAKKILMALNLQ